jgi:hypothetical protein
MKARVTNAHSLQMGYDATFDGVRPTIHDNRCLQFISAGERFNRARSLKTNRDEVEDYEKSNPIMEYMTTEVRTRATDRHLGHKMSPAQAGHETNRFPSVRCCKMSAFTHSPRCSASCSWRVWRPPRLRRLADASVRGCTTERAVLFWLSELDDRGRQAFAQSVPH